MRILYFGGGLGNQIFEYAFYLTIKDKYPKEKIFGVYEKKRFKEHAGGFEIEKIFNVKFPPFSFFGELVMNMIMFWNKFIRPTSLYCHDLTHPNYQAILFNAQKMDLSFYENRENWLTYRSLKLNDKNLKVINKMKETNSVSIHVRRGDFLSSKYAASHAGIATDTYYKNAIKYIEEHINSPTFFVFSDDIDWCRQNLKANNMVFIDWNTGKDSFIDMFLMQHAKANIIANSTFSYWGAYLNKNNPIVIYPEKWKTSEAENLNIFPDKWIPMK